MSFFVCWLYVFFGKMSIQFFWPFFNQGVLLYCIVWTISTLGISQFSSVQSLIHVRLFATPWIAARQASLSITFPGVHPDSRPSSLWCHPAISSSVVPFSFCPQSLPASESFPMSQLFTWDGQSIGLSTMENSGGSLKPQDRATTWHHNPTPGHLSREKHDLKICVHPSVHWSTVYTQDMDASWMSIDKGAGKEDEACIYKE